MSTGCLWCLRAHCDNRSMKRFLVLLAAAATLAASASSFAQTYPAHPKYAGVIKACGAKVD